MRNKLKYVIMIIITLFLSLCSKEEKSNNNNTILGLLLLDQLSGNCVSISKDTTTTTYTGTGYLVPKGGCNASTLDTSLYTTSPSEAKAAIDTYYDAMISEYSKSSSCSSLSTASTVAKNATTVAGLTALQNNLSSGSCTLGGIRVVNSKYSLIALCKDDSSITIQKAKLQYLNVSSVATDMATKLTDLKLATTNGNSVYGFTTSAIANMRPLNPTELGILSSQAYFAFSGAISNSSVDCAKAIISSNPSIKSYITSTTGKVYTSQTDADSITEVLTNSLTCRYGSGFTEVTTAATSTTSTVVQKCPSSYPTF
jgi:hypothetical protein